ncbi:hypothetical protein BJ322DRAFT_1023018 [Thelephora terrestris]|uniref:Uncharacterized protein n=1 Tax=Thelephora terrestris TaxID=56493 RepID=A0A9P6L2G1_9AGAM|nr:hypothetical protein BJ322DRAFT_1024527 [Thelephora terrestris]KAF9781629.1 hypothetical protein BJ322DRAFT_1023018 [Thelephora terrestris]
MSKVARFGERDSPVVEYANAPADCHIIPASRISNLTWGGVNNYFILLAMGSPILEEMFEVFEIGVTFLEDRSDGRCIDVITRGARREGTAWKELGEKRPLEKDPGEKRPLEKDLGGKRPLEKEPGRKGPSEKEPGGKGPSEKGPGGKEPERKGPSTTEPLPKGS